MVSILPGISSVATGNSDSRKVLHMRTLESSGFMYDKYF